jgi:hypothetical protein
LFPVVLLFGLLAMTARNATDPDLWWHLRTGQWIVDTGHTPHADPFSFTRAGHAWVSHEWLTEVVFYELWKHAGAAGLIVFSAIITTAGFMLLYLRCLHQQRSRHWAVAATAFGALASAASWGVRPQMFTFAIASLLLWLVETAESHPKRLLWIPPLFLLWLNLHAGFALGPALLLAYGAGLILETALGDEPWSKNRPIFLRIMLLILVCLALVPLNPSGTELYRYPFDTLRSSGMRAFIGEWFSPNFHQSLYQPFLLAWLLLLTVLASSRAHPKGRVLIPLILTSFAALDAVRHIPIFLLVAIPVLAAALPLPGPDRGSSSVRPLFNVSVVILMACFAIARWTRLAHNQASDEAEKYPQKAVAFLRAGHQPDSRPLSGHAPGRIFVYYDWGGYAVWRLYPEYQVFLDGRADLYGDEILRQFRTAIELKNGWQDVLEGWKVETVVIPPSCALAQALLLDPHWRTTYTDSRAIILTRTQPASENAVLSGVPAAGSAGK